MDSEKFIKNVREFQVMSVLLVLSPRIRFMLTPNIDPSIPPKITETRFKLIFNLKSKLFYLIVCPLFQIYVLFYSIGSSTVARTDQGAERRYIYKTFTEIVCGGGSKNPSLGINKITEFAARLVIASILKAIVHILDLSQLVTIWVCTRERFLDPFLSILYIKTYFSAKFFFFII